jgi:CHAT domain-containing protein
MREKATQLAVADAVRGADYVHLACHGRNDPDDPLASNLELNDVDGLTLREILAGALDLAKTRLVVASACQTAIPEHERVPNEVIGLPAGFLQAGADCVVATLWPVADLSTALLMTRFYEYLLRGDEEIGEPPMVPASALRSAQRWLRTASVAAIRAYVERHPALHGPSARLLELSRSQADFVPFARPYSWAGYVVIGA